MAGLSKSHSDFYVLNSLTWNLKTSGNMYCWQWDTSTGKCHSADIFTMCGRNSVCTYCLMVKYPFGFMCILNWFQCFILDWWVSLQTTKYYIYENGWLYSIITMSGQCCYNFKESGSVCYRKPNIYISISIYNVMYRYTKSICYSCF